MSSFPDEYVMTMDSLEGMEGDHTFANGLF